MKRAKAYYRARRVLDRVKLAVWRFQYRWELRLKYRFGWGVVTSGTDCDGMRYCTFSYHWTLAAAQADADESYYHAEGPHRADVVTGWECRGYEIDHEPDTRDRFAESMGY